MRRASCDLQLASWVSTQVMNELFVITTRKRAELLTTDETAAIVDQMAK